MTVGITRGVSLLALAALVIACAGERARPAAVITDPGQMFLDELEGRLLRARTARIDAVMLASGAATASLSARLVLGEGRRARLDIEGSFAGRPVSTWFQCDGVSMAVRGRSASACAPEVRDALVISFVRMGLLSNAALVIAGDVPDHAAGGAHRWFRAERARSGEPATEIAFDIVVKRDPVGAAVLTLDREARPVKRSQRVRISSLAAWPASEGELVVVESYPRFELDGDVSDVFPTDAGVVDAGL